MKLLRPRHFLWLVALLLFAACKKDDVPDIGNVGDSVAFTANVNGEAFAVRNEDELTTQLTVVGDDQNVFVVVALVPNDTTTNVIGIGLQDVDFESLESGDEFQGDPTASNFVVGTYQEIDPVTDAVKIEGTSQGNNAMKLTITGIDKERQLIAGEFEFTARDPNANKDYSITNGIFFRVKYVK